MTTLPDQLSSVLTDFETLTGLKNLPHELVEKQSGPVLVIRVSNPNERLYEMLEQARSKNADINGDTPLATLKSAQGGEVLRGPEAQLFLKTLSEIQNIHRFSFEDDFFDRYIKSVSGAEITVMAQANHIVLGRRGAGKSMLLLYAWHSRRIEKAPSVWVDMQVYNERNDEQVLSDVVTEILSETSRLLGEVDQHVGMLNELKSPMLDTPGLRKLLPRIRNLLSEFSRSGRDLFVFLDDLHVLNRQLQPLLLDILYSVSRGNRVYLKASAIETLTKTYDSDRRIGLEIPQDAQTISLDYNLTVANRAAQHIETILDSHAKFAGLKSVRRLCGSAEVVPRLTWVAAGVPRDALSLFSQAMTKAIGENRHRVTVSNINMAASDTLSIKLKEIDTDASESKIELRQTLDSIKKFCVEEKRTNAFLVKIDANNETYNKIQNLIHLRLIHVVSEGITVEKAGQKHVGLILDYGFYTGVRAAQSVELFNQKTEAVKYRQLRALPRFPI